MTLPAHAHTDTQEAIARLNDEFRQNINRPTGHNRVVFTPGVVNLVGDVSEWPAYRRQKMLLRAVMEYNEFSSGNNPYGERDFGSFTWEGHKLFWKIDYYDLDLQFASTDAANPDLTARVMTILLAEEY